MEFKMNEKEEIRETGFPFRKLWMIFFILLIIFYIIYHLYNGNYGLKNYMSKHIIIEQKNLDAQKIEKEISAMSNKIEKLQVNNLDSDLLDEEIRKNTGYAKKNEMVIYSNELAK